MSDPSKPAEPTARDRENVRIRQQIAARQQAEYDRVLLWALSVFGPGWEPSHRHYLLEKEAEEEARRTGERPVAAATVYTAKNTEGHARHFTIVDGRPVECASMEAGFGHRLLEPHPTRGFEHRGQWCHTHRYSLCWAPLETYTPRSAEALAKLRATREARKEQRAARAFERDTPLLAWIDRAEAERDPRETER